MFLSISQIVLIFVGLALLFLSFVAASDMVALGAMNASMFAFIFAHLSRIEQKVDAIYEELMAYEIVEDGSQDE